LETSSSGSKTKNVTASHHRTSENTWGQQKLVVL